MSMPTYDFICNACKQRFDVFLTYAEYGKKAVHCVHCNSADVRRRMESMAEDFSGLEGLEDDPKAMGRMLKKMKKEMGEEAPAEFDEVAERLEAGQSPEDIESAMPDLGADDIPA
jgi:putative FmdB family regulatory protein